MGVLMLTGALGPALGRLADRYPSPSCRPRARQLRARPPLRGVRPLRGPSKLPAPTLPANPQSRPIYDEPKWKGYEVTLDLYPDVFAYGILLLPKDLKRRAREPIAVQPQDLTPTPTDTEEVTITATSG